MPQIVTTGQLTITDLNDTKQVILFLNSPTKQQTYDANKISTDNTAYLPNFTTTPLVITPELFVAGGGGANLLPSADIISVTWYVGNQTVTPITEGSTTDYTIPTGAVSTTAKPLSIKTNFQAKDSQLFTCVVVYRDPDTLFDITVKANIDILKVRHGEKGDAGVNAITIAVSNDSHSIPTAFDGSAPVYTGSGTEIHVYEGATELTYDAVGTANGTWKVVATPTSITVGTLTDSGIFLTVGDHSAITLDTAKIVYTISGKRADGTAFSVLKTQTFNKTKAGVGGTSPTLYRLIPSANAISQNVSNVYNPTTITAKGTSAIGNATATDYATRFIIAEADRATPTTYVDKHISNGNEVVGGKVHTPTNATVASIRIRMYIAGAGSPSHGTTQMLDEQIIPIVRDGATGIDSVYLNIWTPNGDTIRNGNANLDIQADLYKGLGLVTPTATQWYVQDPTATTASGGNADGGNGWRLINTVANATTAPTLTLQANAQTKLTAVTHFVKYTWCGLSGETIGSTEASLVVTAGQDLKVTIPAFATNVTKARVYVGLATGVLKYAGDITVSAGNLVISKYDANAEAIPTVTTATITTTQQTLTVRPFAIQGVEGFKCVATYTNKYTAVTVVKDVTDPIIVNILGVETFKNGQGSNVLTVQLWQNGVLIPNSGYSFAWSIYDTAGVLTTTLSSTTDTCTVLATQITGRGVVVCDVSK